jgi:hypothetical protein
MGAEIKEEWKTEGKRCFILYIHIQMDYPVI